MLKKRVITSLALTLLGIFLLFFSGPTFPFCMWILFALMGVEWISMRRETLSKTGEFLPVSSFQYDGWAKFWGVLAFILLSGLFVMLPFLAIKLGVVFWLFALASLFFSTEIVRFMVRFWPFMLIGLCILFSAWTSVIHLEHFSPWVLLYVILVVAASDIGAYFVGKKWGRHFLAKDISPNKTWEGAVGGLIAGMLVSVIYLLLSQGPLKELSVISDFKWLFSGAVLVIAGIVGDLFESRMKRLVNVKDSGRLLPGHGGLLDRFDSHLAALVVAAFVFL